MNFLISAAVMFFACSIGFPILFGIARILGLYAIVQERQCNVYVLFGRVLATIDEPGLHILPLKLGPASFIVNWLGTCHVLDYAARSGIPPQPTRQLGGRCAHGHRHLARNVHQRSRLPSSSRTAIRAVRSPPTSAIPPCAASATCRSPR
jgi:hypothetical protein